MLNTLRSNVTFMCPIWKVTAQDGTVAAYAATSRPVLFNGQRYQASMVDPARFNRKIGLNPDQMELMGIFDDVVTKLNLDEGKWKAARVRIDFVDYFNPSIGSALTLSGIVGQVKKKGEVYYMMVDGLSSLYGQETGALVGPVDRHRTIEEMGIDPTPFIHSTQVVSVTDTRKFRVAYAQTQPNYFRYGRARFTSGNNSGKAMEIKDSILADSGAHTEIELQINMRGAIQVGDTLELTAGYNGTRDQARDRFGADAVLNLDSEPDVPGMRGILSYPQD